MRGRRHNPLLRCSLGGPGHRKRHANGPTRARPLSMRRSRSPRSHPRLVSRARRYCVRCGAMNMSGGGGMSVVRRFGIRCSLTETGLAERCSTSTATAVATSTGVDLETVRRALRIHGVARHTPAETWRLLRPPRLDHADRQRWSGWGSSVEHGVRPKGASGLRFSMIPSSLPRCCQPHACLRSQRILGCPSLSSATASSRRGDTRPGHGWRFHPTRRSCGRGRPRRRLRAWHVGSRRIIDSVSRRISAAVTPSDGSSPTSCHDPTSHR